MQNSTFNETGGTASTLLRLLHELCDVSRRYWLVNVPIMTSALSVVIMRVIILIAERFAQVHPKIRRL